MERADYLRRTMLSSALVAFAATGCALPPELSFASRNDNLLHTLLQGETTPAKGSLAEKPPAPTQEVAPYPTALKPGAVAVAPPALPLQPGAAVAPPPLPLPLQQGATPIARPLDPHQLAGRLPVRIPDQTTISNSKPPAPPRPEQPASYSSPTDYPTTDNAVTLQPATPSESGWPVASPVSPAAPPLEVWNQFFVGPRPNLKPLVTPEVQRAANVGPPPVVPAFTPPWQPAYPQQQPGYWQQPPAYPQQQPAYWQQPPAYPQQQTESPSPSDQSARDRPTPEPLDQLLERLIVSLEEEIRQKTERKDIDDLPPLKQKLRLLQLIANRTDDAVDQIEQLPPAERDAFKQLMFALTTWLSPDDARRSSLRNAKILRALHEANNRLSAVSKLDLKSLIFCEKVESFGWYTEFPRAEFAPKQQVILYVEVQNFAAEEKTATAFETELAGSYQIFDTAGNIIDEHQLPLDKEVCRNFRRDYFLAYRIHLPADIQPGRYRLELTVEDLKAKKDFKGRKQGEAMIEFAIK